MTHDEVSQLSHPFIRHLTFTALDSFDGIVVIADRVMNELFVDVCQLGCRFGHRVALEDVALTAQASQIRVLAGTNGSGKTTLLKILAGFLRPTEGRICILGHDPVRNRVFIMEHARFAFAPPPLYEFLTAWEHLFYLCALGRPWWQSPGRTEIESAIRLVGLADRADDKIRTFTFGMCQRLALALSLVPRPRLLVLDEPTDGLDPLAVLELRSVLGRSRDEHGIGIVLSSHPMVELEKLADHMLVLYEGRVLFGGPPEELRQGSERLILRIEPNIERVPELLRQRGHDPGTTSGLNAAIYCLCPLAVLSSRKHLSCFSRRADVAGVS